MELVSLCSVPAIAMPEGNAGSYASTYLPGYGRWYADGKLIAFPATTLPQVSMRDVNGYTKNLPFHKGDGLCIGSGD